MKPHSNGNGEGRVKRLVRERDGAPEVPLYDLELEKQFLHSCMLYPEIIVPSEVVSSDFYSDSNATIFTALLQLAADGNAPIDSGAVRGHLADSGKLPSVGGIEYLLGVTDTTIPSRTLDFSRLRRLARQRRLKELAGAVTRANPEEFEQSYAALEAAKRDLDALTQTGPRAPTLADCIPKIAMVGPRLPTGLASLDNATRGGIPTGRLVSIVGAPGASKTNLSTWLADRWERAGCAVMYVAADESREFIVTRLGQLDGFDRDLLEGIDPGRRNAFARNARGRFIKVVDPFEDRLMLEQLEGELLAMAGDRPRVLLVDSLQRVPARGTAAFEQRREQLEYIVTVLEGVAKRGAIVVGISEMSRAGYRTGKRDLDISALASAAETRAVEYYSHLVVGLKPVKGERGIIDLEISKNRLGPERDLIIRLSLDFATLGFREIERPDDEDADHERVKSAAVRMRILAAVAREECKSTDAIIRAAKVKRRDGARMLRELGEERAVQKINGVYRVTPQASHGGAD